MANQRGNNQIQQSQALIEKLDKEVFFILSTARCRSSWFGNLFTYKDSFCYNEELRYISNWDELIERIERRPEKYIGFEDPELLHYIETLYELFPNATYVLLERDRLESEMSLCRSGNIPSPIVTQKFDRWYEDIEKFKVVVGEYIKIHYEPEGLFLLVSYTVKKFVFLLLFLCCLSLMPFSISLISISAFQIFFRKL